MKVGVFEVPARVFRVQRWRNERPMAGIWFISPTRGGQFFFVPVWAIGVFVIFVVLGNALG